MNYPTRHFIATPAKTARGHNKIFFHEIPCGGNSLCGHPEGIRGISYLLFRKSMSVDARQPSSCRPFPDTGIFKSGPFLPVGTPLSIPLAGQRNQTTSGGNNFLAPPQLITASLGGV